MNRPGDWNCRACNHLNFQRRESCQRCAEPKPAGAGDFGGFGGGRGIGGGGGSSFLFNTGPDVRPGDWYCTCGAHNFASRSSCFKCTASKDDSAASSNFDRAGRGSGGGGFGFGGGGSSSRSGWKSGDWICTRLGCNEHNFASRMECFRCNAPKDSGNNSTF